MNRETRKVVKQQVGDNPRLTRVLPALGIATSSWYRESTPADPRRRRGPAPQPIPDGVGAAAVAVATANPWYGCQRIGVMCRQAGYAVKNRQAYRVMRNHGLLRKPPFLAADNGPSFIVRPFVQFVSHQYSHVRIRYRTPIARPPA